MYNKLFSKIVTSSIWLEPTPTRIVWLMFIALMNEDGFVQFASSANVAHQARIDESEADEAIKILESPDPNSADPEHDGRRIEKVPGGWMILNAAKYRDLVTREMIKAQTRERVARHRAKLKGVTECNALVTQVKRKRNAQVTQSDTDTDTEEIYLSYPKKVGKPEAKKAIRKALAKFSFHLLLEKTKAFAAARNGDLEFCPNPATWFNQERFNDDPKTWCNAKVVRQRADETKKLDLARIDLPERFKSWAASTYSEKREVVMKWQTWAEVPNSLRQEWWRTEKDKLPVEV